MRERSRIPVDDEADRIQAEQLFPAGALQVHGQPGAQATQGLHRHAVMPLRQGQHPGQRQPGVDASGDGAGRQVLRQGAVPGLRQIPFDGEDLAADHPFGIVQTQFGGQCVQVHHLGPGAAGAADGAAAAEQQDGAEAAGIGQDRFDESGLQGRSAPMRVRPFLGQALAGRLVHGRPRLGPSAACGNGIHHEVEQQRIAQQLVDTLPAGFLHKRERVRHPVGGCLQHVANVVVTQRQQVQHFQVALRHHAGDQLAIGLAMPVGLTAGQAKARGSVRAQVAPDGAQDVPCVAAAADFVNRIDEQDVIGLHLGGETFLDPGRRDPPPPHCSALGLHAFRLAGTGITQQDVGRGIAPVRQPPRLLRRIPRR